LAKANEQLYKGDWFSSEVVQIFQNYSWPGNLRKCKIASNNPIDTRFYRKNVLPSEFFQSSEQKKSTNESNLALSDNEKRLLNALAKTQNNKSEQPNSLKLLEKRLYNKIKLYDIN
jgi:two-component system response regulator HydG